MEDWTIRKKLAAEGRNTQRSRAASWKILNFELPKSQYFKMVWV